MPGIPSGNATPGGGGMLQGLMGGLGGAMGPPQHSAEAAATARAETEAIVQKMGAPVMGSFKKGGIVPRTGPYQLHKGEKVVALAKAIGKGRKKSGGR
jgi:hypothetical protein